MSLLGNKGNVVECQCSCTSMLLVKVTLGISALSFHTSANLHLTNFRSSFLSESLLSQSKS